MLKDKKWIIGILIFVIMGVVVIFGQEHAHREKTSQAAIQVKTNNMSYEDEELGFSFSIDESIYAMLICEIQDQKRDRDLNMPVIEADFYGTVHDNRVPLFTMNVYLGTFDESFLEEKNNDETYIGASNGYSYTFSNKMNLSLLKKEEDKKNYQEMMRKDINNLPNVVTVLGAKAGVFNSTTSPTTEGTQIAYNKETVDVEGYPLKITVATIKSILGYEMKYDSDYFTYSAGNNQEKFEGKNADGDSYPNIYFTVYKNSDQSKKEIAQEIIDKYGEKAIRSYTTIGTSPDSYKATLYTVKEGKDTTGIVKEIYLVEQEDATFTIEIGYFAEVEEGYGTKLQDMLASFVFSKNDPIG